MKKFYCFVLFSILFQSCFFERNDNREILVINNSKSAIYSILSKDGIMHSSNYYYEFQENFEEKIRKEYDAPFVFEVIKPGDSVANHDTPRYWDKYFEKLIDKKATLFIVQKDSVDKYGWKEVFKKEIYNKKIYLTILDLNRNDWRVIYK